jgi:hypothetical protein
MANNKKKAEEFTADSLTEEQKAFVLERHNAFRDLNELTQKCFNDDSLDGRTRQGKLIAAFLIKNKIGYATTRRPKSEAINLTAAQKEFIIDYAKDGLTSFQIAELIFPDREIKNLGMEQRTVLEHIRIVNPDFVPSKESGLLTTYTPPKTVGRIIKKVFDATGTELDESKMTRMNKVCVEKLIVNLSNSRFVKIMNNYTSREDRSLFEEEFVRLTWDKPDLSADEVNLYLNVCKEIINLDVISKHMNKLNDLFEEAEEQNEMSIRLAEIIKTKSSEYHQCESRIENLTKKLQGDRSKRMENKQKENNNILALIQAFQDEDERRNMLNIAEMQKKLVEDEANRLEGMAEFKARILGIAKEDVI